MMTLGVVNQLEGEGGKSLGLLELVLESSLAHLTIGEESIYRLLAELQYMGRL
jgi:hypothetical protein